MKLNLIFRSGLVAILSIVSLSGWSQNTFYYNVYKTWTPELEKIAQQGDDIRAIVSLGSCYDRADGIARDRGQAFEWFKKGAGKGDILATYNLGLYYSRGYCGAADNVTAVKLLEEALRIDNKFAPAYLTLAQIYEKGGAGIDKDMNKAYDTWVKLANLGNSIGQYNAGRYNWQGIGRPRDLAKAKEYYIPSANQGDLFAMDNLASCFIEEKRYEDAFFWLNKAYEKGAKYVCHNLGDLYYHGNGVPQSYEKAYAIFEDGASSYPWCKYRMSVMLMNGLGVDKDEKKGVQLLSEAASERIDRAQYQMGIYYYTGEYVDRDYEKAVDYFKKALESKYLLDDAKGDLCKRLSVCYRFGRGVEANEKIADEYANKSAGYGNPDAKKIQSWLNLSTGK